MATYTIKINEKTKAGKNLVAFLNSLNDVVTLTKVKKVSGIEEALADVGNGQIYKAKNSEKLLKNCLS